MVLNFTYSYSNSHWYTEIPDWYIGINHFVSHSIMPGRIAWVRRIGKVIFLDKQSLHFLEHFLVPIFSVSTNQHICLRFGAKPIRARKFMLLPVLSCISLRVINFKFFLVCMGNLAAWLPDYLAVANLCSSKECLTIYLIHGFFSEESP